MANWKRRNPSAAPAEAFALVAAERGVRRLLAVDEAAARLGLFAGRKATDAAALVPGLITADADPAADKAALTALCDWCARFSPAVVPDPPDGLFLDITGVAHLWGGEAAMAADLIARLETNGIPARAAVAGTAGAAWALARFGDDETFVPPGGERAALATLPIRALRLDPPTAAQIARLGLATIARFADLPRKQLTRRFGPGVVLRLDQALGDAPEALAFRRPPNPWLSRLAFAEPISTPEDLGRVVLDAAIPLCARLEAVGQGALRFELGFHRLDGKVQRLAVGLALPGRDARRVARLFAPLLESVDPGFGIEVVTLAAEGVERLSQSQPRLGETGELTPEEGVAPLVDRLSNRLGQALVWRAEPYPSHVPEQTVVRRPPLSPAGDDGWDSERPRPLRLFRRPEPISVVALVPDDPPIFFRWRGLGRRVRRAEGPERLAPEWWRRPFEKNADPAKARDYYRVEDEAGMRFWLFRAGLYDADNPLHWWLHGLFG
ncbi:MAG: DNA polymerase Y family protein [Caulobacteraceae bacterium]|nr:DNA polymerase Y family protein [Caulobacteraceae bacterium]